MSQVLQSTTKAYCDLFILAANSNSNASSNAHIVNVDRVVQKLLYYMWPSSGIWPPPFSGTNTALKSGNIPGAYQMRNIKENK